MKSSSSSDAPTGGAMGKIKSYLIGALVVLILGALLYFFGLQSGRAQLASQAAQFEVQRNGLESKVQTAEAERDAARDRAAMMEARAALYRTSIDLDARNFGTANQNLKGAATALSRVTKAGTEGLRSEIEGTDLNVAVDLAGQRAKVLAFADQLNEMMPADTQSVSPSSTASSPDDVPASPSAP